MQATYVCIAKHYLSMHVVLCCELERAEGIGEAKEEGIGSFYFLIYKLELNLDRSSFSAIMCGTATIFTPGLIFCAKSSP